MRPTDHCTSSFGICVACKYIVLLWSVVLPYTLLYLCGLYVIYTFICVNVYILHSEVSEFFC